MGKFSSQQASHFVKNGIGKYLA